MFLFYILWLIVCPFLTIFCPTKIIGKKYLKLTKKQSTIFTCNHQSNLDAVILKCRINTKFKVMAKDSLFRSKFKNWFFRNVVGAYPVNRGDNDVTAIKTTLKYLKNKQSLLIFPEGTRNKDGNMSEFKTGVVMFAIKTDAFVVPSAFQKPPKFFRRNRLLIGKPFKFSEMEEFKEGKIDKESLEKATEFLFNKIKNLKEIDYKQYKKQVKIDFKKD